jgi:TrmH family RNA methyltransferase
MSIRVVLVDPKHPGNIGAVARAMKNMGLNELHLVRPKAFPDPEATARASGADDVLEAARVHEHFEDAIADCGFVVGTSSRQRHLTFDLLEPRECAQLVAEAAQVGNVALVFGSEKYGLMNVELARCHRLVTIPTSGTYASLNLAMAVQVIAYEVLLATRPGAPTQPPPEIPFATAREMELFYEHFERVLEVIDFRDRTGGGHLMARIRRLFNRARLDQNEINILRGFLTAVEGRRRQAGSKKTAAGKS